MSKKLGFVPLIMILILIFCPEISLGGAARGIEIWWKNIVPSLFPFMAVSTMLVSMGALDRLSNRFSGLMRKLALPQSAFQAFSVGIISGFPVGAGMVTELHNRNMIDKSDVCYAAAVSSFCSSAFMLTTVGAKLMGNLTVGLCLMAVHYLSFAVTVMLFRRKHIFVSNENSGITVDTPKPFGKILAVSVEKAAKSVINVGGYIVLFSIMIEIINKIGICGENDVVTSLIASFLEISNGCVTIAASALGAPLKIALMSFAVSWSGLCVMCQISGFISECGASAKKLFTFKLLQGIVAAIIGYFMGMLFL